MQASYYTAEHAERRVQLDTFRLVLKDPELRKQLSSSVWACVHTWRRYPTVIDVFNGTSHYLHNSDGTPRLNLPTEPEPQDGLQKCPRCGKATDCLYPMAVVLGVWCEVLEAHAKCDDYFCYGCCNELEGK